MGQSITSLYSSKDVIDEDQESGRGARGVGDPYDMTLREKEILVYIPSYQRKAAEFKCNHLLEEYEKCLEQYLIPMFRCKGKFGEYIECVHHWSFDAEFRQQMSEEYLKVRHEYRKSGRRRLYRALKGETYVTESQLKGFQV